MRSAAVIDFRLWLALICALVLATATPSSSAGAQTGQRPKDKPAPAVLQLFPGNLKQACAHAAERNVPIVAIALLDDESDNTAARNELLASPQIAQLSLQCVLFFSNNGQHKQRDVVETLDGTKRTHSVCSEFGTANCKEHQQHWDDIYNKFNQDGVLHCPQVLVLTPDGKLADRISPGLKPAISAIVELAQRTQAKLGRGLDDATLTLVKDASTRAAHAEQDEHWGSAWRAYGEVLVLAPDGPRAQAAKDGQQRALSAFAKQRDGAEAKLSAGNGVEGYLALEDLARDWTGTEQAAEIGRKLKHAEMDPALKEALAKKRREDEAQALWNEAEAALAAKQPKEAERKLRLLLRKYPDTPAYDRTAKAHPDWIPEKPAEK